MIPQNPVLNQPHIPAPAQHEIEALQPHAQKKRGKVKDFIIKVVKKIITFTKFVFIALASALLYLGNPSLFALGFIVGLVIDAKVRETVAKVQRICAAKPWVVILIGVGSFLALPVAIAAGSFVCGAYVSSKIAGTRSRP